MQSVYNFYFKLVVYKLNFIYLIYLFILLHDCLSNMHIILLKSICKTKFMYIFKVMTYYYIKVKKIHIFSNLNFYKQII